MRPDLESIRLRAEKASPGPWCVGPALEAFESDAGLVGSCYLQSGAHGRYQREYDAQFCANSRQDIPALLAYITELEKEAAKHACPNDGSTDATCYPPYDCKLRKMLENRRME